jgi:tripartite-type tricarboxylate transporter receptor subunit TctC
MSLLRAAQLVLAIFAVFAHVVAPAAEGYPSKPIRLIVPYPSGNSLDVRARQLANHLHEQLGQPIVVDNRGGASGIIGMEAAAKAAADGYTIVLASGAQLAINPVLNSTLPYDTFKDFAPVALLARTPSLLVVSNSVPAKSLKELIALAKEKPGQLNYASQGSGTTGHLAAELFKHLTGADFTHVPYNTYSQMLTDLISGRVAMVIDGPPVLLPQVQAGKLRALAVNSPNRLPPLPDVPTFDEAGVPGFWPGPWYGVLAPAGTPPQFIEALNAALTKALKAPDIVETARSQGQTLVGGAPSEFTAFIKDEVARYRKLINDTGARVD